MLGIIAQEIGCLALSTIAFGICVCAILFAFLFLKYQRKLIPSIGFGMATYFLSVFLGMLTFYVHFDRNYNNHYSNQNLLVTNTINGIIQSDV